jgi:hypothetical protein
VNNSILRGAQLIELNSADVPATSKRPEYKCEIEHARFQNLHHRLLPFIGLGNMPANETAPGWSASSERIHLLTQWREARYAATPVSVRIGRVSGA